MTQTISRVPPLPAAKISAAVYFCLSFAFLPFMAIPLIFGGEQRFGIGLLVAIPLLYAIIGFLSVALLCSLYNVIAPRIGGIQIDLDTTES